MRTIVNCTCLNDTERAYCTKECQIIATGVDQKTVGIVADNYKLNKFKKELIKKGFTDFEIAPFINATSNIKVKCEPNQLKEIRKICEYVELYFKRSN